MNREFDRDVRRYVKEVKSMQRKRPVTLVQVGGGLIALAVLIYLLTLLSGFLFYIAGIALAVGIVLLIVGLVMPNKQV